MVKIVGRYNYSYKGATVADSFSHIFSGNFSEQSREPVAYVISVVEPDLYSGAFWIRTFKYRIK